MRKLKPVYQSLKGMHDILPADQPLWAKMRQVLKKEADFYNFLRIDLPILESAALFERSAGSNTDIVEKQMFIVKTSKGDHLALRPEGTPGVVRSYLQHGLSHLSQPVKLYYEGPMFRHEQPQAGRFRQFYQAGFEIISNNDDPVYDAQAILICYRLIDGLKIKNLSIQANSIGCKVCRPGYRRKLQDYYKTEAKVLCKDCLSRLPKTPLRLLDCKNSDCQPLKLQAPMTLDNLCANCNKHLKSVLEYLEELNLPYVLNHYLVRGLDYYTKTVFEIFTEGADFALAGGGRYDYLIETLGGRHTPAVGGSVGLDRLVEIIKARGIKFMSKRCPKIALIHVGDLAKRKSLSLIETLRNAGLDVVEFLGKDSLGAQLGAANKTGCPLALILGQKEVLEEAVIIRDMKTGTQEPVAMNKLVKAVRRKLH